MCIRVYRLCLCLGGIRCEHHTHARTRMAALRSERVGGRAGMCMRRLDAGVAALVQLSLIHI